MKRDEILCDVFSIFEKAKIVLPKEGIINIYHHNGINNYEKVGAVFVNVINREYCKSYVVVFPNQKYPWHYHRIKDESFYVLFGKLGVGVKKQNYVLKPGEMLHIERGSDHAFWCEDGEGVIFEEISTSYMQNDSVYLDEEIAKHSYSYRKTVIESKEWEGKYQVWKKLNHFDYCYRVQME